MQKRLAWLLVAVFCLGIIPGCSYFNKPQNPEPSPPANNLTTESIKLFYGDEGNEKLVSEERQITYAPGTDRYKLMLEELLKGPGTAGLQRNISAETKVYGTIKQNEDLIVDFNADFNKFAGSMAEAMGINSVVNTVTQFGDIKRVKILVEGQEYIGPSGEPQGFIEPFSYDAPAQPAGEATKSVLLYFGNEDAATVSAETRQFKVPANISQADLIKKVLEELIKGPERPGLYRSIPAEVKVKSVTLKDSIAYVDFSEEMHTKHWHGASGEATTINSVVNTLTEFNFVKQVKMTVEGQPLNIEHAILDEPVGRNESAIKK